MNLLRSSYRYFISPFFHFIAGPGAGCRFRVTCGDFFFRATERKGLIGVWLSFRRLLRCQPFYRRAKALSWDNL